MSSYKTNEIEEKQLVDNVKEKEKEKSTKTIQELDREKLDSKFSKKKEKLN